MHRSFLGARTPLVAATLLIALSACGNQSVSPSGPSSPASGGPVASGPDEAPTGRAATLVIGKDTTADVTMDPARALDDLYYVLFHAMYQKLVEWEFTPGEGYSYDQLVGQLAEDWEVSDDATSFTFRLNPDATFASGNPVTSEDVKFSLERLKNVKGNPSYLVAGLDQVETPDPQTAVVHLTAPDATFLGRLTYTNFVIVDSEVVKANGGTSESDADATDQAESFLSSQSAGSGPYQMVEHTPGERTVLQRVDDWWGGEPPVIEQIIVTHIPDQAAQVAALERGDIDLTWRLPPDQIQALEADGFQPVPTTIFNWFELVLNSDPANSEFVADPTVQAALKLAINYEELADLCPGASSAITGVIPEGLRGGLEVQAQLTQDQDQARDLLAEAGYPDGYGAAEGEEPVLLTAPNNTLFGFCPAHSDVAQKIAADWAEVGVTANVQVSDFGIWVTPFRAGEFQATIGDWYPDFPDPVNFAQAMLPGNSLDVRGRWGQEQEGSDAYQELADLQAAAIAETDPERRLEILGQIEPLIIEAGPIIPLLMIDQNHAARGEIQGLYSHSIARLDLTHITSGTQ
jgi:peptide/nickel transport system substrate-binding protein